MLKKVVSFMGILSVLLGVLVFSTACDDGGVTTPTVLSDEKVIVTFAIDGCTPRIESGTVFVSAPYGTDPSALTPTITVSEGASVSPASGVVQNFTNSVNYTVVAEDTSSAVYVVTVNVTPASTDTSFTSTIGKLSADGSKLGSIPVGTTIADLKKIGVITLPASGSFEIYNADKKTEATTLTSECIIIVTAQNGTSKKEYSVSVAAADRFNWTTTAYTEDGAIDEVLAFMPAEADSYSPVSVSPAVNMTGVITAKDDESFTMQDKNGALMVMGNTAEGVGTKVTITATAVTNFHDLHRVSAYTNLVQVSVGNDLYVQDVTAVTQDSTVRHQLFKYTGFASGEKSPTQYSRSYLLDTAGYAYWNVSDNDTLQAVIDEYEGDFYGTLRVYGSEYCIAVPTVDYFESSGTKIGAPGIALTITSIAKPTFLDTVLTLPSVADGYTVTITTSNNSAIALNGTITPEAADVTGTLMLTVTSNTDALDKGNTGLISVTVLATRATSVGNATNLFFSEYIEGATPGNNRALELANYTGTEIDLSKYCVYEFYNSCDVTDTIEKFDFSATSEYGNAYRLTGTLANEATYVIANDGASTEVQTAADKLLGFGGSGDYGRYVVGFGGDDALALYYTADDGDTWSLVDNIGKGDEDSFSAANITLIRKPGKGPLTTYDQTNDWYEAPVDYSDDLGSHIF